MKNKRGFVLLETIIVICVLVVILITLYSAYSSLLINVKKKSLYDNTEYIYKTSLIRKYLEENTSLAEDIKEIDFSILCSDYLVSESIKSCTDSSVKGYELFKFLKVKGVYLTKWNIDKTRLPKLEATTQKYIKQLDSRDLGDDVYRIIVMYTSENSISNNELSKDFEYATLRFGSRENEAISEDDIVLVNFESNGGTIETEYKIVTTKSYEELPIPTREGYEFDGWYTKMEGGELITEESIVNTNGNITLYAHWKEKKSTLVKVLLDKANSSSVTSYTGSKGELYTFNQAATTQLKSTTDYRYIGNVPNNYITFNNEVWRIIGVFEVENEMGVLEKRVKIVRNESIGTLAWDSGSNKWGSSTLYNLLNTGAYFNRTSPYASNGLTTEAKELIGEAKWYLGEMTGFSSQTALTYYSTERSNASLYKVGKVGLIYASDYAFTYANSVSSKCFTDTYNCEKGTPTTGWMYFNTQEWLLTGYSTVTQTISRRSSGYVSASTKTVAQVVKPAVYLKADVLYVSGNGSSSSPYVILGSE